MEDTMNYKRLALTDVLDVGKLEGDFTETSNALIACIEKITTPAHSDDGGHKFEDDPSKPGVCKHCGWVHPDVPHRCGNHTLVQHLEALLQQVKDIRDGKIQPDVEIRITFAPIPDIKPRSPWWNLFG